MNRSARKAASAAVAAIMVLGLSACADSEKDESSGEFTPKQMI